MRVIDKDSIAVIQSKSADNLILIDKDGQEHTLDIDPSGYFQPFQLDFQWS